MTSLREKAKKIVKVWHTMTFTDIPEHERETLIQDITEALEAAYKQGALARIELPGRKDTTSKERYEVWANVGWNNCIDAIKITKLTGNDLVPNHNFFWDMHDKLKHLLGYHVGTASVVYDETCIYIRDFVSAKLEWK